MKILFQFIIHSTLLSFNQQINSSDLIKEIFSGFIFGFLFPFIENIKRFYLKE